MPFQCKVFNLFACCCQSRCNLIPPHPDRETMKAVGRRARVLTEEFTKKARNLDRVYGGVAGGTVGRVQRKLVDFGEVRGLVFGAFGECSEGVHELVLEFDQYHYTDTE